MLTFIGILISILIGILIFVYLPPYLGRRDWLVTLVDDGSFKIIQRGTQPIKLIGTLQTLNEEDEARDNYYINASKCTISTEAVPHRGLLPDHERLDTFLFKLWGLNWLGIPGIHSIAKHKEKYYSLSDNGSVTSTESERSVIPFRESILVIAQVDIGTGINVEVRFEILLDIHNFVKAIYTNQHYLNSVRAAAEERCRAYCRSYIPAGSTVGGDEVDLTAYEAFANGDHASTNSKFHQYFMGGGTEEEPLEGVGPEWLRSFGVQPSKVIWRDFIPPEIVQSAAAKVYEATQAGKAAKIRLTGEAAGLKKVRDSAGEQAAANKAIPDSVSSYTNVTVPPNFLGGK